MAGYDQKQDFWKGVALERIARTMRPGGVLRIRDLIYDFEPSEADEVFERWFAQASEIRRAATPAPISKSMRTEYSTFRWLFEPMLRAAGFAVVTAEFDGSVFGAYTCVRR